VSGIVGSTTYGVAKQIKLKGVKVLDCDGSGSSFTIAAGITYILANQAALRGGSAATKKLVANLSLGGPPSTTIDNSVQQLIDNGIAVTVAAGNEDANACSFSPSRLASVLTISASDIDDQKADFSNYGSCVDLSAPGVDILSTWFSSNTAITTLSGSSMASPFTAGVVSLAWQQNKGLTNTQVQNTVKSWVTQNVIDGFPSASGGGGKNLLFSLINPNVPPPAPSPNPHPPTSFSNGETIQISFHVIIIVIGVFILLWDN